MPISLSTVTVFVPHATFYFQEGEVWAFSDGKSRSDTINKQVVQNSFVKYDMWPDLKLD